MPWLDRLRQHEARSLARRLQGSAAESRDLAQQHLQQLAHEAADAAGAGARRLAGYVRHESATLADAAGRRALRAAHVVKDDPLPIVMGLVGAICLANLIFGRRTVRIREL